MTLDPKNLSKSEEQALAHLLNLQLKVKELELLTIKTTLAFMHGEATPAQLAQRVLDIAAAAGALPTNKTMAALAHLAFPEGLTLHTQDKWITNQRLERERRQRHGWRDLTKSNL